MASSSFIAPFTIITPNCNSACCSKLPIRSGIRFRVSSRGYLQCASTGRSDFRSYSSPSHEEEEEEPQEGQVQELRVPEHWLDPSKALEESEWLRLNLHKWLDDEYCPEATNVEISSVAARSYYKSLVEKQTDLDFQSWSLRIDESVSKRSPF
ncbi:uncharacterized protein LOC127814059 isoform X2 [Diospyros lotus]|uniref:uncharacterized protein LOC127814059 isoform X2 n=1 Tax=Diospyros lotus TaxID=55363 RepID=UPI002255D1B2|nr:uncharacterized protein LOC127814059 isoform X2 [Diospyros lotus]